jgi:hypothetical protein
MPFVDAVIGWVAKESQAFIPPSSPAQQTLRIRAADAVIVATAAVPVVAL